MTGDCFMGNRWVCVDCYFTHHYGYASDDPDYVPDCKPLGLLDPKWELTVNVDSETGDGIHEFSKDWCPGCGTHLAGSRYRLAAWKPWFNRADGYVPIEEG